MDATTQTPIKRILCVGTCLVNIIHVCKGYPKEGANKLCYASYWQRGGHASSVATVLRGLGAKSELLAMLSETKLCSFLIKDIQKVGIDIKDCGYTSKNTPCSTSIVVPLNETRTIVQAKSEYPELTIAYFKRIDLHDDYGWIHFEARNTEETLLMMHEVIHYNTLNDPKIKISLTMEDDGPGVINLAELADYIFIHKSYAKQMHWQCAEEAILNLKGQISKTAKPIIICRWEANKVSYLDETGNFKYLPAPPKVIIADPIGETAAFVGGTIYGSSMLRLNFRNALHFGNLCAGYKSGTRGFSSISNFMHFIKQSKIQKLNDDDDDDDGTPAPAPAPPPPTIKQPKIDEVRHSKVDEEGAEKEENTMVEKENRTRSL